MLDIDDPEDTSTNPSTEPHFNEVVQARVSRRAVVTGGLASAAAFLVAGPAAAAGSRSSGTALGVGSGSAAIPAARAAGSAAAAGLLGFSPIARSIDDAIRVPTGYTATPFIPWGTPIIAPFPPFVPGGNSAADQEKQIGMHHDGMHYFPFPNESAAQNNRHGLLAVNHEYVDEAHLATGSGTAPLPPVANWSLANVRRSQAAHGVSVVEIQRSNAGQWSVVTPSTYNRRITANTPMSFSGPATGHRLLKTTADPAGTSPVGTFNNCANGYTPWGTYLTCEENFNGYFRVDGTGYTPEQQGITARYGVGGGDTRRWTLFDSRFVTTPANPNEPNRFGWVVEIDPFDAAATPIKRTALGRVKHEGAWTVEAKDGRVVVYMGDDQVNEFMYKFISNRPWKSYNAPGESLDDGVLYVAKFGTDGSGIWLPLVQGLGPLTPANGFADEGDVLVKTRLAATLVGATPMDRPEWVATNPNTRRIYLTCTNNTSTAKVPHPINPPNPPTPANPQNNSWGHIVCWQESDLDFTGLTLTWNLIAIAGNGAGAVPGEASTIQQDDAFGSPDGLWTDSQGRMWIQTDGTQPGGFNDQMLAADLATRPPSTPGGREAVPDIRRFLTGPKAAEVTGLISTPDLRTMFCNIQHPGEGGALVNGQPNASVSTWPPGFGTTVPRSATVIITKNDGGIVGT